jgi:putative glutamine amidotransferase
MTQPIIGITMFHGPGRNGAVYTLGEKYVYAIRDAGGAPVLLPGGIDEAGLPDLISRLDGILFSGGGDIAVERFAGTSHPEIFDVDPERDRLEMSLLQLAVRERTPFLGICRGCQVVNVALGGTLYTHIPDQLPGAIKHRYDSATERSVLAHTVKIEPGSRVASVLGADEVRVNSLHHQGIDTLAPDLKAAGHSPDGLVEAAELPGHPFGLAVQWHPEWLTDQPEMRKLFATFVQAAGNR